MPLGFLLHTSNDTPVTKKHVQNKIRRESTRDDTMSRPPKELCAERLLADAQDVARIRWQAKLRATHQGVCWMASNWSVGGKKGVLSGKRYLVLCDSIIWAELRAAEKEGQGGDGVRPTGDPVNDQGDYIHVFMADCMRVRPREG